MGNYSKNPQMAYTLAVEKGYSRVRFQQGKPILDRELNLAADLAAPNRILQKYLGNGVPEGDGFNILNANPDTHDFTIKAGRCFVNGFEVVLANDTTYKNQPHKGNVRQFPTGTSAVYLRVFPVEVNETLDADLRNAGDIGFETALRERMDWEVVIESATVDFESDHFLLAILIFTPGSGPPPPPPTDTSSTSLSDTTTSSSVSSGGIVLPPDDGDPPTASVADARVKGLTLTKVRADLGLLMNPARTTLKDNIVGAANIQNAAVTNTKIQDGAVTTAKLSDNSINNAKIQDGAVTATKLLDNSVNAPKIVDGSVSSQKLANGAVTAAKVGPNAVGFSNLNFLVSLNTPVTLGPSASTTITTVIKANTGPNAFILLNLFGDGEYTWSERVFKGDRVVTITNQTTSTITITLRVIVFQG